VAFAGELFSHGVTLISIGDPTATGEILGPKMFEEYVVRYLNRVIDGIHGFGAPVIVHICGKIQSVKHSLPQLRADAVSTDALVNLKLLKEEFPGLTTMGNVSTFMLERGETDKVVRHTQGLIRDGIDIIAPACGLSTSTKLETICAMTDIVKATQ
jgi:[methyl-Co(III) methanol-specific corrinoid protein]:coenzyme M methyltransferase